MSLLLTNCITCTNTHDTLEDLLRKAFVCDGDGNVYIRIYNPSLSETYCGQFDDYVATTRTIDGVDHTGFIITHSLDTSNPLFVTVWNDAGVQVSTTYEKIDNDNIFLVTDGLEDENGRFCISK